MHPLFTCYRSLNASAVYLLQISECIRSILVTDQWMHPPFTCYRSVNASAVSMLQISECIRRILVTDQWIHPPNPCYRSVNASAVSMLQISECIRHILVGRIHSDICSSRTDSARPLSPRSSTSFLQQKGKQLEFHRWSFSSEVFGQEVDSTEKDDKEAYLQLLGLVLWSSRADCPFFVWACSQDSSHLPTFRSLYVIKTSKDLYSTF